MRIALLGLGKMGANMARRLLRHQVEVVGYNRSYEKTAELAQTDGLIPAQSLEEVVKLLTPPRILWLMLPSGDTTQTAIEALLPLLKQGDLLVDGGNANYHDSMARGLQLQQAGIDFMDAGTSGGVWGLENGYCLMVGGSRAAVARLSPVLKVLAPSEKSGWAHVGPVGAGHFTKMIHNGIEYGMMQALAEGLALMQHKQDFKLDLAQITELWRHGSVVRSWLLDLTAKALDKDQALEDIAPFVPDSGEGRWTAIEAIEQGVPAPVMTLALQMRFASQDQKSYVNRLLSMMRNAFGGHAVKKNQ